MPFAPPLDTQLTCSTTVRREIVAANWQMVRRDRCVLAALWVFCTLWNFDKAFHIDDAGHMVIAQWIAQNPLRPMSGLLFWGDTPESIHITNQPHLFFYAMAVWGSVFGWSEISMHALQSIFCLLALIGMHKLAVRFTPHWPLVPTTLLAFSPAFAANQNSMVDIPLLALWLGFFVALCGRVQSTRRLHRAAAWCSAAILTKYTSLVLYLMLFYEVLRRQQWRFASVLLTPLLALLAWSAFNYWDYGGIHIAQRKPGGMTASGQMEWFLNQALAWLLALGAIVPGAIGLVVAPYVSRSNTFWRFSVGLLAVGAMITVNAATAMSGTADSEESIYRMLKLFFIVSGAVLLVSAAGRLVRERLSAQAHTLKMDPGLALLALWAIGAFSFIVGLAPFMATRHVLLALPPILLLTSRWLPADASKTWLAGVIAVSSLVATGVAAADRWYANLYRTQATEIRKSLPSNATIWFAGHWGWQWYATQVGMLPFDPTSRQVKPGDYLVYPDSVAKQKLTADLSPTHLRDVVIRPESFISRLATPGAGLYSSTYWKLPWTINMGQVEVFHILRF
ncbi:glycosyltransferase family 39 protein [Rhodoferax sp.]|uniref:ArnT family glycosyltransferase n=1 Tax=Rhodoferax sp. TaxID=50421 RepID=UPI001EC16C19|nr:glycosyltransferase family 39 protein [Rhodoferax sp.]MBT9505820.1 hypothetical protein [Rhodoferax sp.]